MRVAPSRWVPDRSTGSPRRLKLTPARFAPRKSVPASAARSAAEATAVAPPKSISCFGVVHEDVPKDQQRDLAPREQRATAPFELPRHRAERGVEEVRVGDAGALQGVVAAERRPRSEARRDVELHAGERGAAEDGAGELVALAVTVAERGVHEVGADRRPAQIRAAEVVATTVSGDGGTVQGGAADVPDKGDRERRLRPGAPGRTTLVLDRSHRRHDPSWVSRFAGGQTATPSVVLHSAPLTGIRSMGPEPGDGTFTAPHGDTVRLGVVLSCRETPARHPWPPK